MSSGYRLAPALAARLLGLLLVVLAVVVFVLTLLTALLGWTPAVLLVGGAIGVAAVFVAGWLLTRRLEVVTLDEQGYRVRLVRGAGVTQAAWAEVAEAVTTDVGGIDCVVLRLKDGRTTSIPVAAMAADRNDFVREVRERLRRGEDLRPL